MEVKFIRVTKPESTSTAILTDDGTEKGKWFPCTPAVREFTNNNFKSGDKLELTLDGKNVTKATKAGVVTNVPSPNASQPTPPPVSLGQSSTKPTETKFGVKSPEVQELIVRQSTMASAAQALQAMNRSFEKIEEVEEAVIRLYNKMLNEIKK
jgi:hypothetical protein